MPTGTPASGGNVFPVGDHAVHSICLLECSFFRQRQERADLAVFLLDAGIVRLRQGMAVIWRC